jgi:hypothetical protein
VPANTPRAARPTTRRDVVRLVAVGGITAAEALPADRRPTVRLPAVRAPETSAPSSRHSAVRLKGSDDDSLPYAVVDLVTADLSNDPRHDED